MHIEHEHSHGSGYDGAHTHAHVATGGHSGVPAKDLALLRYMHEHNKQHTLELADIGLKLSADGAERAAELISSAVHYFEHANEELEKAVALLGG